MGYHLSLDSLGYSLSISHHSWDRDPFILCSTAEQTAQEFAEMWNFPRSL